MYHQNGCSPLPEPDHKPAQCRALFQPDAIPAVRLGTEPVKQQPAGKQGVNKNSEQQCGDVEDQGCDEQLTRYGRGLPDATDAAFIPVIKRVEAVAGRIEEKMNYSEDRKSKTDMNLRFDTSSG